MREITGAPAAGPGEALREVLGGFGALAVSLILAAIEFATAGMDNRLFVSRYLVALPSADQAYSPTGSTGVSSGALTMIEQPAASAGASFQTAISSG